MALLLNIQNLSKSFGSLRLFESVSFTVSEGDRIGLIGPNGSGKSTLLEILAGRQPAHDGIVAARKLTKVSYVAQVSEFAAGTTVRQVMEAALDRVKTPAAEREARVAETLGRAGFDDFSAAAESLSGGWRKRLAIAEALVEKPDLLLLDEPTNHLDLPGIEWLEKLLISASFASVVVSHDRYFLENVATSMAELNPAYPDGLLFVAGNYSSFLERKAAFLHTQQMRRDSVENLVRRELDWLRRGPKARTTKSKSRIAKAHELMDELSDLTARTRTASADIDFSATSRKTKRLIEFEKVSHNAGEQCLFENLDFTITAGMRVGLVGANGSGKTTFLRLLQGELKPDAGRIRRAAGIRIAHFEQNRALDPGLTLRRALAPHGDAVVYQGRSVHVAAWAARFLFPGEKLDQPVSSLSGGERARVLIAGLMLEPADILLLDEPTNDLDIPTLDILEENLLEFPGAMVLVAHDRYLLDRVASVVLGLDGAGRAERFADYAQWDHWIKQRARAMEKTARPPLAKTAPEKKKLSYLEAREYADIESRIAAAEHELESKRARLQAPEVVTDGQRLREAYADIEAAQAEVDALYERWAELEEKKGTNTPGPAAG